MVIGKRILPDSASGAEGAQRSLPPQYAYAHVITDVAKPKNTRIQIGGQPDNLGEEAPRAFLSILSKGQPSPFRKAAEGWNLPKRLPIQEIL